MQRVLALILIGLLSLVATGCGNSERDRGRNSQLDRPKPTAPQ